MTMYTDEMIAKMNDEMKAQFEKKGVLTKRQNFLLMMELDEVKANSAFYEMCSKEAGRLDKNARPLSKAEKEKQREQAELMDEILNSMKDDEKYTISDMVKNFDCCEGLSNQKVSSMVNKLRKECKVDKEIVKNVSYFCKLI